MMQIREDGFEVPPQGALFARHVNFSGPIGFAYERCINYEKDFHFHNRWNIAFPRGSCKVQFTEKQTGDQRALDSRSFLVMRPNVCHRQMSLVTVYDVVAFMVTPKAAADLASVCISPIEIFPKTTLLEELVQRTFSRLVMEERDLATANWLLQAILSEVADVISVHSGRDNSAVQHTTASRGILNALNLIEANLYSQLTVKTIAQHACMSVSSLFRAFQETVGTSPLDYMRKRRMEEAHQLLSLGRHTVQEVCFLVGYEDPVSFSKSFKALFGESPSKVVQIDSPTYRGKPFKEGQERRAITQKEKENHKSPVQPHSRNSPGR